MPRLTITITDDQSELLDDLTSEDGEYESKSAAVRSFIDEGESKHELQAEIDRLRERLESREDRIDELESQLGKRSEIEQQIEQLPTKIKGEQTYQERRQRVLDSASTFQRLKWQLTGVPVERIDAVGKDDD